MARAGSICAVAGCPHPASYRGRCRGHAAAADRAEKATVATKVLQRSNAERQRRKVAVEVHRARYGDYCPGWGVPGHAATDLTAQHVDAVGYGGSPVQPLAVLCRACNSRHSKALRDNVTHMFD